MNINELIKKAHDNAVSKGFYDCEACGGDGDFKNASWEVIESCKKCNGTGKAVKNIGELLMLVVSELGEALEAHRKNRHNFKTSISIQKPEIEEWKIISNYPDYLVSNLGQVQSNDMSVWNGKVNHIKQGRILSPGLSKNGYYTVSLRGKTFKIASLVAEAFIGIKKDKVINHINGDKTCDWTTNLEYVTSSENNIHAIKTGLSSREKILNYFDKIDISLRFKKGETAPDIHKDYKDVSLSAIKNIRQKGIEKYTDSFEIELADAVIRIADMCGYLNIDLEKHIELKMKYNETREYKHGKKF